MKALWLGLALAWMTCSAAGAVWAACDPGELVARFSHVTNAETHPKGLAAARLAARVNAELDGRMCLEVFPNATLFDDNEVLDGLRAGEVELAALALSRLSVSAPALRLFELPFLFRDRADVTTFQAAPSGWALLASLRAEGLHGLAYWHDGMIQMSANRPLALPADAQGLRFRVQTSEVRVAQVVALGGAAQQMAFSELYPALQAGLVDGQENTWSNIHRRALYEVQDGITETNHGVVDYVVVTSAAWLDGLEPDLRADFLALLAEVTATRNSAREAWNATARQAILDAGGTIRVLSPDQRAAWVAAMQPVWAEYAETVGQVHIDAARAIAAD